MRGMLSCVAVPTRTDDTFGYNARSEVTAASILSNAYTYAYDFIGSHTASTVNSVETTYTANNLNQYSEISVPSVPSVENLSYDLDGNLLTRGVWSYTWDAENRLVAAFSNSVCVVSNAYDYMSRRVTKWTPSYTTTFIYDGWKLVQELTHTQTHTLTNLYVWAKICRAIVHSARQGKTHFRSKAEPRGLPARPGRCRGLRRGSLRGRRSTRGLARKASRTCMRAASSHG